MAKFSELLRAATPDGTGMALEVPADWAQGRSTFGGLQAALAVRAMRRHVPEVPLRTLQVTFIGPIVGRLHVETSVLRTGSSATHVEARITGEGGLGTIAIGVFGKPRTSMVTVERTQPAVARDKPITMPFIPGLAPAFVQHFQATWLRGALPLMGSTETAHVIEVGIDDDGPATEAHAIALADSIPPLALAFLRKPTHGGSLTWLLELLTDRFEGLAGWRIDAELMAARDGYTSQSLVLWGPDGRAVALGRQHMTVFG